MAFRKKLSERQPILSNGEARKTAPPPPRRNAWVAQFAQHVLYLIRRIAGLGLLDRLGRNVDDGCAGRLRQHLA